MKNSLYSFIWRVHFFAGLIVSPFLIILALSGSVYLFKPQLDKLLYSNLVSINTTLTTPLSETVLVEKIKKKYPDNNITHYHSPNSPSHSAQFDLAVATGTLSVFINPYDGSFLGERDNNDYIQEIARKIHGELLIGDFGDRIVELVACWALILLVSGVYLSWPRSNEKFWGFLLPRFTLKGRAFWRDIHTICGVYGSIFIFLLILTGLPWSGIWGNKVLHVWEQYPEAMFAQVPKSKVLTETLNEGKINVVPWAVEKVELPTSKDVGASSISLQNAISIALKEKVIMPVNVAFPKNKDGVFTVSTVTGNPKEERVVHIDQYNGLVLASIGYNDYSKIAAVVQYGISLHEGKYFGILNQLLGFFGCLMLIGLSITGVYIWWTRKPIGKIGAPQASYTELSTKNKKIIMALMISVGILFPLVGLSFLMIILASKLFKILSK